MPYVLEFNRDAIGDKMQLLARLLDLPVGGHEGVMTWILDLRQRIGIPQTLADIGVASKDIATLAPMAAQDPSSATNPLTLTADNCAGLFQRCIEGRLDIA
jgi:alcohol dehydrogenase class IV